MDPGKNPDEADIMSLTTKAGNGPNIYGTIRLTADSITETR